MIISRCAHYIDPSALSGSDLGWLRVDTSSHEQRG